jgi:nicotinamide-nucleotide amidase
MQIVESTARKIMYNQQAIDRITRFLINNKETVSIAESVTSGHLQAALSLADGATNFFQGGITAYNLAQKTRHLDVDPLYAIECNCVSPKVAEQMASGVAEMFSTEWSLAITGYAALIPEAGINERFAFFAIAYKKEIVLSEKIVTTNDKLIDAQLHYTNTVLEIFARLTTSDTVNAKYTKENAD